MYRELRATPQTRLAGHKFEGFLKTKLGNDIKFPNPLPPYGKEAAFLYSMGVQPRNDIFIFAGLNAWQKAKAFENTQVVLCLPLGTDPSIYFWPVHNCSVLLFDTGGLNISDIERISYYLLCAKATIVRVALINNTLIIYRRDVA
jgi:hypothetical protein